MGLLKMVNASIISIVMCRITRLKTCFAQIIKKNAISAHGARIGMMGVAPGSRGAHVFAHRCAQPDVEGIAGFMKSRPGVGDAIRRIRRTSTTLGHFVGKVVSARVVGRKWDGWRLTAESGYFLTSGGLVVSN